MSTRRTRQNAARERHRSMSSTVVSTSHISSQTLTSLPLDIIIRIQMLLEPFDILRLRQVNKALHDVTKYRQVWTEALRQVCYSLSIYEPTYPAQTMSLLDLEHACTAPYRFVSFIKNNSQSHPGINSPPLSPLQTKTLNGSCTRKHILSQLPDVDNGTIERPDLFLIPGGRFVVTFSEVAVALWDLGYHAHKPLVSKPVASMSGLKHRESFWHNTFHATKDGNAIRFLRSHINKKNLEVKVYEVRPQDEHPEFISVATLTMTDPQEIYPDMNHNCVTFLTEDPLTLAVWNFEEDTFAQWPVSDHAISVGMVDDTLLLLTSQNIAIYKVPPLQPTADVLSLQEAQTAMTEHHPCLEIAQPFIDLSEPDLESLFSTLSMSWYQQTPLFKRPYLDVFLPQRGGTNAWRYTVEPIRRYQVGKDEGTNMEKEIEEETDVPRILPVKLGRFTFPTSVSVNSLIVRPVRDYQSHVWGHPDGVTVNLALSARSRISEPGVTRGEIVCITVPLLKVKEVGDFNWVYDFCPVTGRVVTIVNSEIGIYDYLMPPDER